MSVTTNSPHVAASPRDATPTIELRGLVKRYGDFTAVDHIDMLVYRNEIFGILGPNGAGKTTTLEMLEGLRRPDAGSIRLHDVDVVANPNAVKRIIGVQLQTTALFDHLSCRELVALFSSMYGGRTDNAWVDHLIALVNLEEKASNYVNQLSGGQRQRLSIAIAMVNDPPVVFLDEPTTGLDPQARRNLWDLVRQLRDADKTIVLTTHYMEEAEALCDRVAVMDHGRIIACDTPLALVQSLGQSATIRARVLQPLDSSQLSSLPGVTGANVRDEQLEIQTDDVPATLAALLQLATSLGVRLDNLSTSSASLEDVFLTYTGRSLRD